MKLFYALLLFPVIASAVPENKVYPNSGATDAKMDQETNIISPSAASNSTVPQEQQEKQERPKVDPDAIQVGPYDKDGNYTFPNKNP